MRMYDIIRAKRDGGELSEEEIRYTIQEYTKGNIPDYQISALLMAIFYQGMTPAETAILTHSMAHSGDTIDLSRFGNLSVDKHSTGGVGDKTSLILSPIVACLGAKVAKMSGRGLGHTGGTVDKLESIPGYRTEMTSDEFLDCAEKTGIAVVGQSGELAPADKKLYALRDVTATIDSIPLIASSIMSKKLAAGAHSIVLDVKCGSGAFMKTPEDATKLAECMVSIAKDCNRNCIALITDMDRPLGNAVGNWLEVEEAIEVLKGEVKGELRELCISLAAHMASLALDIPFEEAYTKAEESVNSGAAFEKMKEWISAQGGDTAYLDNTELSPKAEYILEVKSDTEGYISKMNAEAIGTVCVKLGGGREKKTDTVDHSAGIILAVKTGDKISKGDTLCTLYTNKKEVLAECEKAYKASITISDTCPHKIPLIYNVIK